MECPDIVIEEDYLSKPSPAKKANLSSGNNTDSMPAKKARGSTGGGGHVGPGGGLNEGGGKEGGGGGKGESGTGGPGGPSGL